MLSVYFNDTRSCEALPPLSVSSVSYCGGLGIDPTSLRVEALDFQYTAGAVVRSVDKASLTGHLQQLKIIPL